MRLRRGEGRAVLGVVRGALRLRRFLVSELAESGLTPMQVEVLLAIRRENRASQAFLSRQLQVTRQTIDAAMVELEGQELVDRVRDAPTDRRSWLWWLTDQGSRRLDGALDVLVSFEERCFPGMTEEDRLWAARLLERGADELALEERMKCFPLGLAMR